MCDGIKVVNDQSSEAFISMMEELEELKDRVAKRLTDQFGQTTTSEQLIDSAVKNLTGQLEKGFERIAPTYLRRSSTGSISQRTTHAL